MDTNTLMWIIFVITLGLGLMFAFSKKKRVMDKSKWVFALPLLAIAVVVLAQTGSLAGLGINSFFAAGVPSDGGSNGVPTSQQLPSGFCPGVEDTTVTLAAVNPYTGAATGGTHRYSINGAPALTVSDAGTFIASPGDKVQVLWYNASTTGGYFSDVTNEVVPCAGTTTFSDDLYQNGTVSIQVFNEEGQLIDGTTNNETLAAGDVVTLDANIKGSFQKGMPYGGVLIAEYNTTEIDDVIADFGDGITPVPVSSNLYSIAATDHGFKGYSVPAILSNQKLDGSITIDADDTTNPGSADDIDLTLYQNNYFINDNTGGSFDGPAIEDEDNTATQPTNSITFTLATD